jgi:hypothetical protein
VAVAASTRGSGGSSGDGGPLGGLGLIVGAVTNPNPFLAWLIASAAGVALYLSCFVGRATMIRRRAPSC